MLLPQLIHTLRAVYGVRGTVSASVMSMMWQKILKSWTVTPSMESTSVSCSTENIGDDPSLFALGADFMALMPSIPTGLATAKGV